ncbi:glycosyltransferase [Pseudovibrio sp. Tun.PSC04-5.I4]|uniref:glycosyltransferase n=1 Tax=Pseudovibrio sp. Tun.PSC04-5.I4 TaxID=1798213 RepID=UPI00088A83EE|nr:glycosyltransferase [Pseudovibrio sp. Tun.PSC04-5.I4]SDQ20435.1 Glycosyl transferase family 8 [Pseudovibrio sp. Tun.PSC04-5.I4]
MPASTIQIYIGYDSGEIVAFHTLCQSIIEHASQPVSITPIALSGLSGVFARERHTLQSTEFSFSRFLTPYLSGYKGWSIFLDCDMIVQRDIAELWNLRDQDYSLMCCKHDYQPKEDLKFLGNTQTKYEKKNWSSVMLFNNAKCLTLTPDYVNNCSGLELHQFKWLENDDLIGSLPLSWNHLVGVYVYDPAAALVHYTEGGPYFKDYAACDYSVEWHKYFNTLISAKNGIFVKEDTDLVLV